MSQILAACREELQCLFQLHPAVTDMRVMKDTSFADVFRDLCAALFRSGAAQVRRHMGRAARERFYYKKRFCRRAASMPFML